ncbi:MAG TPA: RNA polymerase sigma factor [Baekduia sp.]|uniref:RNA polymerase sigma factor n=1 Tax=Baekduia sp. TaxID=2600305 RepID=UPI002B807562|nr:RNA polymerase sigma factor [Baekduia sp.]HMJ33525.1 RNA polymerase sigma factor [Baekduia sp.]
MLGRIVNRGTSDVWTATGHGDADDRLVDAARLGDPDAFAVIYQRYKLDVWHLAWFSLRDHHDAEDAVQETFLKAQRALGQYRRNETLRPWLLTICRNACRDRLRVAQRHDDVAFDEELAVVAGAAPDREGSMDFHRALSALPDEDREAFLLVDVLGCRSEEAAQIAGVRAASTLRSRLGRARRALAPAVAETPAPQVGAEVWGVFHSARQSALVLSEEAIRRGRHPADALLVRLHESGAGAADPAAGSDLVSFLERLDRRIPGERTVLAVVDERPAGAAPWLAGHPRWRMQRAPTHASWVGEVDAVLARCLPCTAAEREALRALLCADEDFVWTGEA